MFDDEEVIPSGMLLVFLCLVLLVGLMIILKTCCHCDRGQLVADPSSPSTAATNSTSISVINSSAPTNGQENHGFIDIELEPPPSYEEAIKLPRPNNNP